MIALIKPFTIKIFANRESSSIKVLYRYTGKTVINGIELDCVISGKVEYNTLEFMAEGISSLLGKLK